MRWTILISVLLALSAPLLMATPVLAVNPDEMLDDPVLEARARDISAELRCLVCQNQSIDDSDASLARDLRLLVRERLVAGDADSEVFEYIVGRYGEFVLLKPYFGIHTFALWATAPVVLLLAIGILIYMRRRQHERPAKTAVATAGMSDQEQEILASLKNDGAPPDKG